MFRLGEVIDIYNGFRETTCLLGLLYKMTQLDHATLEKFYARVSAPSGIDVTVFQADLAELFKRSRSDADLRAYRLNRAPWKKLSDEVVPVARFLKFHAIEGGRLRFPLDDNPPDCWFWKDEQAKPVGIEVTIAQGTERYYLSKELVENGIGRGFVGVSDDLPRPEIERAMARPRTMFTESQALSAVERGVRRCMQRKDKKKFIGHYLLIQVSFHALSPDRWDPIVENLRKEATLLPFSQVYIVGDSDGRLHGYQLK